MDIIIIYNGLGNQMSQYAFYLAKKKKYPLSTFWCPLAINGIHHNGFELDNVFGINYSKYIKKLAGFLHIKKNTSRSTFVQKHIHRITEPTEVNYNSQLLEASKVTEINLYQYGWYVAKYFENIRPLILKTFCFNTEKLNIKSKLHWQDIRNQVNSCSIHVRRGDYLSNDALNNIATEAYYLSALNEIKQQVENVKFFVFSNDIAWCRTFFIGSEFTFVDCNVKEDSWQDMFLISQCKHHVNANSTFSWWGTWLSDYTNGITIFPSEFLKNRDDHDFYMDGWIKIDSKGNKVK